MKDVMINDVHFGHRLNSNWHFESLIRFFYEQLIPEIKENNYKNVWMNGDWFESRNSCSFNRIDESIKILEEISKIIDGKIYMLVGNHDLFYKNDMGKHNFASFKHIPKVEILLGKGMLEIEGKSVFYSSYDSSDNIYDYLTTNKIKADVGMFHLETDGSKVMTYVNKNFKYGYSGHIHMLEEHGNFFYLPSTQQNKTDEVISIHGYSVIDWSNCKHKMVDNKVSGRFITVEFGDELSSELIKNNFVDFVVDKAKVRKLSNRKLHQDVIENEFKTQLESFEPAIMFETKYIDSEKENSLQEVLSEADKKLKENDLINNANTIEDDILDIMGNSDMLYGEESMMEVKEFMDKRES